MRSFCPPIKCSLIASVVTLLAGCGGQGAQESVRTCWNKTLTAWVVAQTPGGYADPLHDIPRATYAGQVQTDAAYFEAGRQPPGGINGLEVSEFAKVQRRCGKLKITTKS